jgi:hypothetical protein
MSRRVSKDAGIAWKQGWAEMAYESIGGFSVVPSGLYDKTDYDVKSAG